MNSEETKNQEQVGPEQKYDERRRAFLKKAAIVAAATPLITTLLMEQNSAAGSINPGSGKPCCSTHPWLPQNECDPSTVCR